MRNGTKRYYRDTGKNETKRNGKSVTRNGMKRKTSDTAACETEWNGKLPTRVTLRNGTKRKWCETEKGATRKETESGVKRKRALCHIHTTLHRCRPPAGPSILLPWVITESCFGIEEFESQRADFLFFLAFVRFFAHFMFSWFFFVFIFLQQFRLS